jgi:hypothetical protein
VGASASRRTPLVARLEPMADSFPRQKARTRNFTLGAPRSFEVAADGSRVVFLSCARRPVMIR